MTVLKVLTFGMTAVLFWMAFACAGICQELSDANDSTHTLEEKDETLYLELRIQIQSLVRDCSDLLTKSELDDWSRNNFVNDVSREEAEELIELLSRRVYRIAGEPLPLIARRLGGLTSVCFGLGDVERGLRHLERMQLALVTAPNEVTFGFYREVVFHLKEFLRKSQNSKLTSENKRKLTVALKAIARQIPIGTVEEFMESKDTLNRIGISLFVLTEYKSAAEVYRGLRLATLVKEKKKQWDEIESGIGAYYQFFLWNEIQANLAIGNKKECEDLIVEYLNYGLEFKKNWFLKKRTGNNEHIPSFESVYLDCIRLGYGALFPSGIGELDPEKNTMKDVGFFRSKTIFSTTPIPRSALTDEGKKLKDEMKGHVLFKSDKIEKAIQNYLDDPDLKRFETTLLLKFLLIEYKLTNGRGKEAFDLLKELEKEWAKLGEQPQLTEGLKKLFSQFATKELEFPQYRQYLCTYFDNKEFRDLCKYRKPWKGHEFFFHFARKIPEHASRKPTKANSK